MGSGFQTLCLLLFISIVGAWDLKQHVSNMKGTELNWVEENGAVRETQIQKVSGDDHSEGTGVLQRSMVFEKFRVLLGLKRSRRRKLGHGESGFSPAPAPIEASAANFAPSPAPVHLFSAHSKPYPPQLHSNQIPSHDLEVPRRNGNEAKVRRIVIAVAVSIGAAVVLLALAILVCHRFAGSWQQHRSQRAMPVSSVDGGSGRLKLPNHPNSVNKVSFDPGPEVFYLDTLGPFVERASSLKQSVEPITVFCNENPPSSPQQDGNSSGETVNCESDNTSCSSANESLPLESPSSDDESFHSICNSHSSSTRNSNVSVSDSGIPSPISSPINSPMKILDPIFITQTCSAPPIKSPTSPSKLSPDDDFTVCLAPQSSPNKSRTSPSTPDLKPALPLDSQSSPSHSLSDSEKTQLEAQCCSSIDDNNLLSSPCLSPSISPSSPKKPTPPKSMISSSSPQIPVVPTYPPPPFPKRPNSICPPPPPPCQFQQFSAAGKNGSSLPKLKPLHWDKVRAVPDRSMVWDKLRSSSFELDEEMIESLFGYNLQSSSKNEEAKSKNSPPNKHVLDAKRLQNITILSKALNSSTEQICDALMQGEGLSVEQLEALVKMAPTKEEEQKLSNYPGDINELGSAEKFVKAMLDIPLAFVRIEAMLYKETFEDEASDLKKSFAMLEEACKELKSSRLFLRLLEAVLKTGNRMNVGTIRGGARAFKLDALLKLADVKGTDGKTTLLHFVVQEMIRSEGARASEINVENNTEIKHKTCEEREEDYRIMGLDLVAGLSTELCNVKKTASIDLDVLASSVSNLLNGMTKLKQLTQEDSSVGDRSERFIVSMKSFMKHAQKSIKELQEDENRVLSLIREITEYFHGDLSKDEANPLRIFVIVRDCLGMLDRVCKEVRSLKIHNSPKSFIPLRQMI